MSKNREISELGQVLTVNVAAESISVGNVTINTSTINLGGDTISGNSFSGTANNTIFVGSVTAANVVSNSQLQSNVSMLQGQITSNAATAYTNAVSYTDGKILTANGAITGNAATAYSNSVSYTDGKILTANSAITGNAATAYTNSVSYTDSKIGTANTAMAANAAAAYSNATVFASNASNINTGTLAEARLPYRMNQNLTSANSVTFGDLTLTGNLYVGSNVNVIGANNLSIIDNMIYLNANNTVANPDLGFAGNYNDGTYHHAGFFRDASDGIWKVFDNYLPEPDANSYIDTTNTTFHLANFQANNFYAGNTSTNWFVANTLGAYHTGTINATSFSIGTSTIANSTGVYTGIVNGSTISVGTAFTANATVVNAVSYYAGATLIANTTGPYGKTESTLNVNSAVTVTTNTSTNTFTIGTSSYFVSNGNFGIGTTSPGYKLDVNGTSNFSSHSLIAYDIATPSNYYNGLQLEVQATSGTAGIGLHRAGYSHVGIYHDTINILKFGMSNGTVTLNYNAGTLWGSGNDGTGSGLDADLVNGVSFGNICSGTNGTATADTVNDMNSLTAKSGFYLYNSPSNAPTASWYTWINASGHYSGDRYGFQLAHEYWANDIWVRGVNSNVWRSWRKILDSGNYSAYSNFSTNTVTAGHVYINPGYMLYSGTGNWTGEYNKIQWHANNLYLVNLQGGYLLILRASGSADKFLVDASGNMTASGNVTAYSDEKLKENIKTINNALSMIKKLRGVTFDWIETKKPSYGLIAQEVEKVMPELVLENKTGTVEGEKKDIIKSVDYSKMVSVLIEGMKEQQKQIEELQSIIQSLKEKIQ